MRDASLRAPGSSALLLPAGFCWPNRDSPAWVVAPRIAGAEWAIACCTPHPPPRTPHAARRRMEPPPAQAPPASPPLGVLEADDSLLAQRSGALSSSMYQPLAATHRDAAPSAIGFIDSPPLIEAYRRVSAFHGARGESCLSWHQPVVLWETPPARMPCTQPLAAAPAACRSQPPPLAACAPPAAARCTPPPGPTSRRCAASAATRCTRSRRLPPPSLRRRACPTPRRPQRGCASCWTTPLWTWAATW